MQFDDIIGREAEKAQLRSMVQNNRLSHSLLFLGREGSGALQMAIAFAQYILCERVHPREVSAGPSLFGDEPEERTQTGVGRLDSCGACPACIKASQNIHPDLHFSYPVLKRDGRHDRVLSTDYINDWRKFLKTDAFGNVADWLDYLKEHAESKIESPANKQGNISVHECDDILHKLSLRPFESESKILIMWMPEFLQKEGNRLLKLIEEPPAGTLFIFVAEDDADILPTILSRTQLVKIPLPSDEEVEKLLLDKHADPQQAAQTAALAAGNMREAMRIFSGGHENWEAVVRNWFNAIVRHDVSVESKWIDEMAALGREKQKQFLNYFLHLLELSIRRRFLTGEKVRAREQSELDFAHTLNKMCDLEALEEMAQQADQAIYFIERNANAKLLFHALTIRFFHLIREKQVILIH